MASIRARLDTGNREISIPLLLENLGKTPPGCCLQFNSKRQVKCDQLKDFVDFGEFKEKCLQCQTEMIYSIDSRNIEELKDKNRKL